MMMKKPAWMGSGSLVMLLLLLAVIPESESGKFYEKTRIYFENNQKYNIEIRCNLPSYNIGWIRGRKRSLQLTILPGFKYVYDALDPFTMVLFVDPFKSTCHVRHEGMKGWCDFLAYDYDRDYYRCKGQGCYFYINPDAIYRKVPEIKLSVKIPYCNRWWGSPKRRRKSPKRRRRIPSAAAAAAAFAANTTATVTS